MGKLLEKSVCMRGSHTCTCVYAKVLYAILFTATVHVSVFNFAYYYI